MVVYHKVMADLDTRPGPRDYLCSLRQHVREPISNAVERAKREHREVTREREAFETFAERVADHPTEPTDDGPVPAVTVLSTRSAPESESLRHAYSETVMAVAHYETVYDEPLTAHVRAELGPEIATLFQSSADGALIPEQRRTVVAAARQAATDREEFCGTLDVELESLRSSCTEITAILDELDSTTIPAWYHQQFTNELTSIIRNRQAHLAERSLSYLDGHNLCESLYHEEPQTYPVLMAVARLRDCVTVRA
jgi:hypothetical protein